MVFTKIKTKSIRTEIQKNLAIIFKLGYDFLDINVKQHGMTFWDVLLESKHCLIHVFQNQNEIFLCFASRSSLTQINRITLKKEFDLYSLIYHVTDGERIIGLYEHSFYTNKKSQYHLISELIKQYYDQIYPLFFEPDYWLKKEELLSSSFAYQQYIIDRYIMNKQPREKHIC